MQNDIKVGDMVYYDRSYDAQRVIEIEKHFFIKRYVLAGVKYPEYLHRASRGQITKIKPKADE